MASPYPVGIRYMLLSVAYKWADRVLAATGVVLAISTVYCRLVCNYVNRNPKEVLNTCLMFNAL